MQCSFIYFTVLQGILYDQDDRHAGCVPKLFKIKGLLWQPAERRSKRSSRPAGRCAAPSAPLWRPRPRISSTATSSSSSSTGSTRATTATAPPSSSRRAWRRRTISWCARRSPAGQLTAAQYLALDDIAERHGGGNLRVTTRQGIQFHGLLKGDLKPDHRRDQPGDADDIGRLRRRRAQRHRDAGADRRPGPPHPAGRGEAAVGRSSRRRRAPITRSGSTAKRPGEDESDSLYGDTYLPRKFKIGLAAPEDNSVDVLTNDLALVALFDGDTLTGYNVAIGGGLGMTHNKPKTYPRLATPVVFVPPRRPAGGDRAR